MDIVVVTGAASGIGRVYALALAQAGYGVVAADIAPAHDVVGEISALGGTAIGVEVDVSNRGSSEAMATAALARS
jgi:NAD(P)-dependent dehydrogenase (short-subunit alcohol dehydrogenase family)